MKILILAPYVGQVYGGISAVLPEIASALGHQLTEGQPQTVDVVTTNANDSGHLDVPLDQWIQEDGYRIRYFASWHRSDFIVSGGLLKWLWQNVHNYDLVHGHTLFSPLVDSAYRICRWKKVPYIATPHGMLEPWALAYKSWKKQLYFRLVTAGTLRQSLAIQALTTTEAQQIQQLGYAQTLLIPNGIRAEQFEQPESAELAYVRFPNLRNKQIVLFLSRIDPKKGLDLLARAFSAVHQSYPDTHLVIAGPDSIGFLPTAQDYFEKAGCADVVTFTGMVKGDLKSALLSAAAVYVLPSYSEGFSMSVLEGMAAKLPCIFTERCNFSEAQAAGVAYETKVDANAIASALMQSLADPTASQAMGERASAFIFENYTWNSIASRLVEAYRDRLLDVDILPNKIPVDA